MKRRSFPPAPPIQSGRISLFATPLFVLLDPEDFLTEWGNSLLLLSLFRSVPTIEESEKFPPIALTSTSRCLANTGHSVRMCRAESYSALHSAHSGDVSAPIRHKNSPKHLCAINSCVIQYVSVSGPCCIHWSQCSSIASTMGRRTPLLRISSFFHCAEALHRACCRHLHTPAFVSIVPLLLDACTFRNTTASVFATRGNGIIPASRMATSKPIDKSVSLEWPIFAICIRS